MTTRRAMVAGGVMLAVALLLVIGLMSRGARDGGPAAAGAVDVRTAREPAVGATLPAASLGAEHAGGVEPLVVERDASAADPPRDANASADAATGGFGSLVVSVTWTSDGQPAPGIPVSVTSWGDPNADALTGRTDDAGLWTVERCPTGVVIASTDRGGRGRVSVSAGAQARVTLQVPLGVDVTGVVLDDTGRPVAGAGVWVSEGLTPGDVVTLADGAGRFELRSLLQRSRIGARAAGHAPSLVVPIEAATGTLAVTLRLADGAAVAGLVLDPRGNPVSGARVQFGRLEDEPPRIVDGITREAPPPVDRLTRDDGRFEADELPAGRLLVRVRAPECSPSWNDVELPPGQTTDLTLELPASATVGGTVRDGAGRPVAGAVIVTPWHDDFGPHDVMTAEDGTFAVRDVPVRMAFELAVVAPEQVRIAREFELSAGESRAWDPVLAASAAFPLRIVDSAGRPAGQHLVRAQVAGIGPLGGWSELVSTDADGRASLRHCGEQPMTLTVYPPRFAGVPLTTLRDVRASPIELLISLPDRPPVARLHGRVVGPSGGPPHLLRVDILLPDLGEWFPAAVEAATGSFRSGDLGPGDTTIKVTADGAAVLEVSAPALAADEDRDLGEIRLPDAGP